MISTGQILAAGLVTALGVVAAGWRVRWQPAPMIVAGVTAFALIVAWRSVSNLFGLNGDFLPAVSVGDTGCLVVGALAPLAVATGGWVPRRRQWVPAVAGGVVGFLVNVVIL